MSLELIQQQAVKTYNENVAYFKEHHPKLYQNLVFFETALNEKHIQAKFDLQYKENYFEIIGLEQNIPFYGQNSLELSKTMVNNSPLLDATKNSFKAYYEHNYNDEIAQIALESDMLVKYILSNAPIVHYVNQNLPQKQLLAEVHKFIIFGVGLGLHISYIHQQINAKMYCIVEPNLEIFRLSLFVTNYAQLAKEAKLFLCIAQNEIEFRETFNKFYAESFILNHYFKFFQFGQGHDLYIKTIQNFLVSQPHYLYSYDRTFLSLLRTHSYISQGFHTLNVQQNHQLQLFEKPILYLAAGPSLQRNIEFVQKNQDKFIIVAIYATLPILEKYNIKPNIVTQYDEQDYQVLNTLEKINNISFFHKSIFIFSSHLNAKLMSTFPKDNIFIFQAMFELKKEFGMLTSPSIGELTYALLLKLGAKNIYILGLDLAMDMDTNQTHIEGHTGSKVFSQLKDLEDSDDTTYSYRKNTILVRGNFLPEVKSIPVFKTNIDSFAVFSKQFKPENCKVHNLSNGAYLEGAIPTKIESLELDSFIEKKESIHSEIYNALKGISEVNYNRQDLDNIQLKISGAKKIKKTLEHFFKIKSYQSIEEYKNKLIMLLSDILFNKYNCDDLQQILINYSSHIMHHIYYLFSLSNINKSKNHFYEFNKVLNIQINKIINTYIISISYTKKETNLTKKLNKFIKEYEIKKTIYCEPQFKELVETSLTGNQSSYAKEKIGFFAIEENLSNNKFITYVEDLLNQFPNVSLILCYFYEYQKTQAKHKFKKYLDRTKFLIPNDIKEIAHNVGVWFTTSDKTTSLKKANDILLNNYSNIYSIMISEKSLESLEDSLIEKSSYLAYIKCLQNTPYFNFVHSLKGKIDEKKLKVLYKKGNIGFFALEENLTKEFVERIVNIFNQFPSLNFTVFYFSKKEKEKFELQFKNLLSRFIFILPKDIYEIAENTEILTQADIKNQSFFYNKLKTYFDASYNLHYQIFTKDNHLQSNLTCYKKAIIENYSEIMFTKSLIRPLNDNNIENDKSEKTISCLLRKEDLNDPLFINYLKEFDFKLDNVTYNIFSYEEDIIGILKETFPNWKVSIVSDIRDITKNSGFLFVHNNFSQSLAAKYILSHTKNILLIIFHPLSIDKKLKDFSIIGNAKMNEYLQNIGITDLTLQQNHNSLHLTMWEKYTIDSANSITLNTNYKDFLKILLQLCIEKKEAKQYAIYTTYKFYEVYGWLK